jgi:hypothetical protein
MAYDRYETRGPNEGRHDQQGRWRDNDDRGRVESRDRDYGRNGDHRDDGRGHRDQRGFFERAGDEISSWFEGDRSHRDERGYGRDHDRDRYHGRGDRERGGWFDDARSWFGGSERNAHRGPDRDRERNRYGRDDDRDRDRGHARPTGWSNSQRDYDPSQQRELWGAGDRGSGSSRGYGRDRGDDGSARNAAGERSGYRPMTGDYGRSEGRERIQGGSDFARNRGEWDYDPGEGRGRSEGRSKWDRDDYRGTSFAGSSERGDRNRERGFERDDERSAFFEDDRRSSRRRAFDDDRQDRGGDFESGHRALNEDEHRRRERGPHMLDRSFSGTYR